METPIKVKHNQVIGQIRSVIQEDVLPVTGNHLTPTIPKSNAAVKAQEYMSTIILDPDNKLSIEQKREFERVNERYKKVFSPNFGTYNDKSGLIRASVNIGNTKPNPKKGKVPSNFIAHQKQTYYK